MEETESLKKGKVELKGLLGHWKWYTSGIKLWSIGQSL